jgi:hypothetical protein
LGTFISFNESRKKAFSFIPPANSETISSAGSDAAASAVDLASRSDAETILRGTNERSEMACCDLR